MGLVPFSVSLHQMSLSCSFVEGNVAVGVNPELPVEGMQMIFNNALTGDKLWAGSKASIVKHQSTPSPGPNWSLDTFPVCTVWVL